MNKNAYKNFKGIVINFEKFDTVPVDVIEKADVVLIVKGPDVMQVYKNRFGSIGMIDKSDMIKFIPEVSCDIPVANDTGAEETVFA